MAEIVTTFQHLVTFSTYTGTNGRPMAQITLAGDHAGIPTEELDRMCAEWCTSRGVVVDDEPPRYEGGAVIVTQPVDLDDTAQTPPAEMAWPLDVIAAVVVHDLGDDE